MRLASIALCASVSIACSGGGGGGALLDGGFGGSAGSGGFAGIGGSAGAAGAAGAAGVGASAGGCPTGLSACSGACVNLQSDAAHCGACDTSCPADSVCVTAKCQILPADCTKTPCPSKGFYCDLQSGKCLAGCIDVAQCELNETCDLAAHQCTCSSGFHDCSGACVSSNDPSSCGTSCVPCPSDPLGSATCNGGSCAIDCNSGALFCEGACRQCPTENVASTQCSGSQCVPASCTTGSKLCAGTCASCPTGSSIVETACAGSTCIASSCASGYHLCATGCCVWQKEVVDTASPISLDIAVGPGNQPLIVYGENGTIEAVRYATRSASGWSATTLHQPSSNVQLIWVAIAAGPTQGPQIAFDYDFPPPIGGSSTHSVYVMAPGGAADLVGSGVYTTAPAKPRIALTSQGGIRLAYEKGMCGVAHAWKSGSSWVDEKLPGGACDWEPDIAIFGSTPHIAWFDVTNDDLFYATKSGTSWQTEIVDSAGEVGNSPDIALDSAGVPHIVYTDYTNKRIKYATRSGGTWKLETVDPAVETTYVSDIAVGPDGKPQICYRDTLNKKLRYGVRQATGWKLELVDSGTDVGASCAIALDAQGGPQIAYRDSSAGKVMYAH